MGIHIVGGGAIGLLFAAKLALAEIGATLWTRTEAQSKRISEEGLLLVNNQGEEQLVRAASEWLNGSRLSAMDMEDEMWILLAVKQTAIESELLSSLKALQDKARNGASVICLQNGIGHLEKLAAALGGTPVYAAVTTIGAKREDSRTVKHTGIGELWFGEWDGNGQKKAEKSEIAQKMLLSSLQKAGFHAILSKNMKNRIYQKLLINAVINPLTALFDVTNGELPLHPGRLRLMRALHKETYEILVAAGMERSEDRWDAVLDVCSRTSANVSSMLADVKAGRLTEIEAINGAVSGLAKQIGRDSPLNDAMTALIASYGEATL